MRLLVLEGFMDWYDTVLMATESYERASGSNGMTVEILPRILQVRPKGRRINYVVQLQGPDKISKIKRDSQFSVRQYLCN